MSRRGALGSSRGAQVLPRGRPAWAAASDGTFPGDVPRPARGVAPSLWFAAAAGPAAFAVTRALPQAGDIAIAVILAVAALQVALLAKLRHGRGYLRSGLWLTPLPNLLAATLRDPLAGVLTVGAGLASVLVGLGIAQTLAARARVRMAGADPSAPDFPTHSLDVAERPEIVWRRDRAALGLVLPALALALLLLPLATLDPVRFLGSGDTPGLAPTTRPDPVPGDIAEPRTADAGDSAPGASVGGLTPDGADPWLARQIVLEAAPSRGGEPAGHLGALYFRMLVYMDVAEGRGWTDEASRAKRLRDAEDGEADGWCDVDLRPAPANTIDFHVRHTDFEHVPTGAAVLVLPPGAAAISLPEIRVARGAMALTDVAMGSKLTYHVLAPDPRRMPYPNDRTRAQLGNGRATGVPLDMPGVSELVDAAKTATGTATTDLGKARAIVRYVRDNFAYVDFGDHGVAPLTSFVNRKAGTCEQFAQATVVMMRSVGLPARVATGFLMRTWDADLGAYVARGRDAHAWAEVDFAGCGWTVFDPTPDSEDDPGDRPGPGEDGETSFAPPSGSDYDEEGRLVPVAESPPPEDLEDLLDSLSQPFGDHLWLWLLAVVVAVGFVARAFLRRAERPDDTTPRPMFRARTAWERLLGDLAKRGHVRRASQTPLEFAAAVVASPGGERYAAFVALTGRQQAARFGGRPLSSEDERAIDAFRAAL